MSTIDTLQTLLEEQLKDIYSAEKQLTKALPKMAKACSSDTLREAIETHLEETEGQIVRLDEIAEKLGVKLSGKKCAAMEGLVEEGVEAMEYDGDENLVDAAIIAAAQRVEHYEIAAYGTAKAFAEKLNLSEVVDLLEESLDEESSTDEKLTTISEDEILAGIEVSSEGEESEEEEEEEKPSPVTRGKRSESRM
jgi:ferritin-like metal-binding protein YciE